MRWFGHVWTITINALVKKSKSIQVERIKKGRGRQINISRTRKKNVVINEIIGLWIWIA